MKYFTSVQVAKVKYVLLFPVLRQEITEKLDLDKVTPLSFHLELYLVTNFQSEGFKTGLFKLVLK